MKDLGYLMLAYALTAGAVGAYLLSLGRRRRSLERKLQGLVGSGPGRPGERAGRV